MSLSPAHRTHIPRLVLSHHVLHRVHGAGLVGRFNGATASFVAAVLSNMWFFWFCVVLDVVSIPAVVTGQMSLGNFLSSVVIQLLALPVLSVQSARQQATSDARAEADHDTITALLEINKEQLARLTALEDRLAHVGRVQSI